MEIKHYAIEQEVVLLVDSPHQSLNIDTLCSLLTTQHMSQSSPQRNNLPSIENGIEGTVEKGEVLLYVAFLQHNI